MPDFQILVAYTLATLLIMATPGPGVISVIGFTLASGRGAGLAAAVGATFGNLAAMAVCLAGAGVVLSRSHSAFHVLIWIGGGYLFLAGWFSLARARGVARSIDPSGRSKSAQFAAGSTFAVTALNPTAIIFFIAYIPQFISPDGDYVLQCAVLLTLLAVIVCTVDAVYALAAAKAAALLQRPKYQIRLRQLGGVWLMLAGIAILVRS